jgi:Leucine-rich repeat (LRR) protein/GTPase SAR1 family protein
MPIVLRDPGKIGARGPVHYRGRSGVSITADDRIAAGLATNATTLDLSGLGLVRLPGSIEQFTDLEHLNLSGNQLSDFPEVLALRNLTHLDLSGNQLSQLPGSIGELSKLEHLYLSGNRISQIPHSLAALTALTSLDMYGNVLQEAPEVLAELEQLTILDLSQNDIRTVPVGLGRLTRLTRLYLNNNRIEEVPQSLGSLICLTRFYINNNQLRAVPDSIGNLTALEKLDLAHNLLIGVPETIGNLTSLQRLYLNNNRIAALPDSLKHLTVLDRLYLNHNLLTDLPHSIPRLSSLTWLYANDNRINSVPPEIGDMRSLTWLDLSNNHLSTIPWSFASLGTGVLALEGNPLTPEFEAAHLEGTAELTSFLRLLQSEGTVVHESKLVVVGEGEVGKTSLLGAMAGDPWNGDLPSTHGVDLRQIPIAHPDGEVVFNSWDFGGQPVYRSAHQLYFTAPAVYIVAWKPRLGAQVSNVEFWIRMIKHRAGDAARIHVVATHADDDHQGSWIDQAAIVEKFGTMISGFHHVDSRTRQGIDALKRALAKTAAKLPHIERHYPQSWLSLLVAFRDGDAPYLTYREYETRALGRGLSVTSARSLVRSANALGHWLHYGTDDPATDLVVFKPNWLSKAIGAALTDAFSRNHGGLITQDHLSDVWTDPARPADERYPRELHETFRGLMHRFDISYNVDPQSPRDRPQILLAPLVRHDRPSLSAWDTYGAGLEQQSQVCEVIDSTTGRAVIPEGVIYQLIVRFNRFSLGQRVHAGSAHWQRGMILDHGDHGRALVVADDNRIVVTVRAAYPQFFLNRITEDIREHIAGFWHGLEVKTLIPCDSTCPVGRPGRGLFNIQAIIASKRADVHSIACYSCGHLQDVDSLMLTVPSALDPAENRLVGAVREALSPEFAELRSLIDESSRRDSEERQLEGQLVRKAVSRAEESYRSLIRALDDPARNGPRLFTVVSIDRSLLRPGITTRRVRISLWCEYSRQPVSVLSGDDETGVYDIDVPLEWLVKASPWLRATAMILRTLLPIAADALDFAQGGSDRAASLAEYLRNASQIALDSSAAIVSPDDSGADFFAQGYGSDQPAFADPALLRALHRLLEQKDPTFGGLRRVRQREGYLWVHPRFLHVLGSGWETT